MDMKTFELGITTFAEVMEDPKTHEKISYDERIRQVVDEIKLADEIGLDFFWYRRTPSSRFCSICSTYDFSCSSKCNKPY